MDKKYGMWHVTRATSWKWVVSKVPIIDRTISLGDALLVELDLVAGAVPIESLEPFI